MEEGAIFTMDDCRDYVDARGYSYASPRRIPWGADIDRMKSKLVGGCGCDLLRSLTDDYVCESSYRTSRGEFVQKLRDIYDDRSTTFKFGDGVFAAGHHATLYFVPEEESEGGGVQTPEVTVFHGNGGPEGDIWRLQCDPFFAGALFQVASNFNALEQMAPYQVPGSLQSYMSDHTQGPAASISAFAAALYRRYLWGWPDTMPESSEVYPGRFVKGAVRGAYEGAKITIGGWLVPGRLDPAASVHRVAAGMGMVGVLNCSPVLMNDAQAATMYKLRPGASPISQAFCAAYDLSRTERTRDSEVWADACLYAAYYNTLAFACVNKLNKVVLTLMGGGVFRNSGASIARAIEDAMWHVGRKYKNLRDISVYLMVYDVQYCPDGLFEGVQKWNIPKIRHLFA